MEATTYEPTLARQPMLPGRQRERDNLAVVRMWWMLLESEWRTVLGADRPAGALGPGIVTPCVRDALAEFEEFDAETDDFVAAGDCVAISLEMHGRIRGSGERVDMAETWVCRVAEGAVIEVRDYRTLDQALDAMEIAA